MKRISLLALVAAVAVSLTACHTTRVDPTTGQTITEFDPVKTQQVKDTVTPIGASAVRRVILNSPQHAAEIGAYFRAVGSVFCQMSAHNDFDPVYLIGAADAATAKLQATAPGEIIDIKNALIALYKINYEGRFRAELPSDQWPKNVADVICASIDQGLKDAGQAGTQ